MTAEDESAAARAARLPIWRGRVEPVPLKGGITNTNFLVEDAGRRCVVRIGGDIEAHGILRRNELAASRAAHLAGVSPEVIYAEPGALVLAFIEGRTLTPEDIRNPLNINKVVDLLKRTHEGIPKHLRGPGFLFWVFHALRDYGHILGAAALPFRDQAERLERAVGPVDLVFGHNDLLAANVIDDGSRLWLIDWDYAGFNSPLFDLGGLASNNAMPEALERELLQSYFGSPADDDLQRRYRAMKAASALRETLWSMVSERQSTLDFDYAAYTAENLARYQTAFADFAAMD
jgi:thiamine kinase-like enzyme